MAINGTEFSNLNPYVQVKISDTVQMIPCDQDLSIARIPRSYELRHRVVLYEELRGSECVDRCLNIFTACLILTGTTAWFLYKNI